MSKHTPGPWDAGLERMGDPDKRKIWATSLQVASAASMWISQEVQEANARLIAAAPEMLEALKEAKEFIENLQLPDSEWSRTLDLCVAAIAKAEDSQ